MSLQKRIWKSRIQNLPENISGLGSDLAGGKANAGGIASAEGSNAPVTPGMKPGGGKGNRLTPDSVSYWNAQKGEFEVRDDTVSWDVKTKADSMISHIDAITTIISKEDPTMHAELLKTSLLQSISEFTKLSKIVGNDEKTGEILSKSGMQQKMLDNLNSFRESPKYSAVLKNVAGVVIDEDGTVRIGNSDSWEKFHNALGQDLEKKIGKSKFDELIRMRNAEGEQRSGDDDDDDPDSPKEAGLFGRLFKWWMGERGQDLWTSEDAIDIIPPDSDTAVEVGVWFNNNKPKPPPPPPMPAPTSGLPDVWNFFPPPGWLLTAGIIIITIIVGFTLVGALGHLVGSVFGGGLGWLGLAIAGVAAGDSPKDGEGGGPDGG